MNTFYNNEMELPAISPPINTQPSGLFFTVVSSIHDLYFFIHHVLSKQPHIQFKWIAEHCMFMVNGFDANGVLIERFEIQLFSNKYARDTYSVQFVCSIRSGAMDDHCTRVFRILREQASNQYSVCNNLYSPSVNIP
jgi:hypothetical protein